MLKIYIFLQQIYLLELKNEMKNEVVDSQSNNKKNQTPCRIRLLLWAVLSFQRNDPLLVMQRDMKFVIKN